MRLRTNVIILIVAVSVTAIVGFIGVTTGRSLGFQGTPDKASKICDPTDCRISEDKRPADCSCRYSVLLIDLSGRGPELTNVENGVNFDLNAEGSAKQKVSWTTPNSQSGFLFLDSNQDRAVDNGGELFGNLTSLPPSTSEEANGFLSLSRQDRPELGGNGDGEIDRRDAVFSKLRVWWDTNHNGLSEPSELRSLKECGIESISLTHKKLDRSDQYGNLVRYEADIYGANHKKLGTAYEVVLLPAQ